MSFTVTFVCCGLSFFLGYKLKAYFETNQEKKLELLNFEFEEQLKKVDYQLFLERQEKQCLQRDFNHFKEQAKTENLSKIIKEEEKDFKPSLNFLSKL